MLMLKLAANPPPRSPQAACVADISGNWFVGHTKARCEKAFAWELHGHGIAYYLPLIERVTVSTGRKRRAMMPLFPSYVFFCGTVADRYTALTTDRLCQVIAVTERAAFVGQLASIERALESDYKLDFYPHAVVGKRCRVRAGTMQGIEGTVVCNNDVTRLVLEVSMLGSGAALEIAADLLEAVDTTETRH